MKTCGNSTEVCRAIFPPQPKQPAVQTFEHNRGRAEARCLIAFDISATAANFPFVEQAARLTRCFDSDKRPAQKVETEFLLSSLPASSLPAKQMLDADRGYWGIETGLHLRLDVTAGEDRSRVRLRVSALNLAMIRRAVVSVAVHWIRKQPKRRKATMSGFFDFMAAKQSKRAFSLVTRRYSSALSTS